MPSVAKHVRSSNDKSEAYHLAIARLDTGSATVPLVASSEREAVRVSWWNQSQGVWSTWSRQAAKFEQPPEYLPRSPECFAWLPVSLVIGLTAINDTAFLLSKRNNGGCCIDRLGWNQNTYELLPTDDPMRIPFPRATGERVWAGTHDGRLFVVAQCLEPYELVLLICENPTMGDLSFTNAWKSPIILGQGGWDYDVLIEGEQMGMVFRTIPYALKLPIHGAVGEEIIETSESDHVSLQVRILDLNTLALSSAQEITPGCEHPQLQTLDPLTISGDWILAKYPLRIGMTPTWQLPPTVFASIRPASGSIAKCIIRRWPAGWGHGTLFSVDLATLPRSASITGFDSLVKIEPGPQPHLVVATVHRRIPAYLVDAYLVPEKKGIALLFLYHRQEFGALWLSSFLIANQPGNLIPQEIGYNVVDINHRQIPRQELSTHTTEENLQFFPWTMVEQQVEHHPTLLQLAGLHCSYVVIKDRQFSLDNTIGGALVRDRGVPGLGFFSYTDLGDGGVRAVYTERMPSLEDGPANGKDLPLEAVGGPGNLGSDWIDLPPAATWRASRLEGYNGGPVVSGLDKSLELLWLVAPSGSSQGDTLRLKEDDALEIEKNIYDWTPDTQSAWLPVANDPFALRYSPTNAFPGQVMHFQVRSDWLTATYSWNFGDNSLIQVGQYVEHTYTAPSTEQPYEVRVTATLENGENLSVSSKLTIRQPLWNEIWTMASNINNSTDLFEIRDHAIIMSRYDISFQYDSDGQPDQVTIKRQPTFGLEYKFLGPPFGQGYVQERLPINIQILGVEMKRWLGMFVTIQNILIKIAWIRLFTPCILTSERRSVGHRTELLIDIPAALAAKPLNEGNIEVDNPSIEGHLKPLNIAAFALISGLGILGLVSLAVDIIGQYTALQIAFRTGQSLLAAVIFAVLVGFVAVVVSPAVMNNLSQRIRSNLESDDFQNKLVKDGLFVNSGEGLAEALAVETLRVVQGGQSPPATGDNRTRRNFFEMVFVTDGNARVLVRK
jgi:hypothetical protein